jgi:hypothetical protein
MPRVGAAFAVLVAATAVTIVTTAAPAAAAGTPYPSMSIWYGDGTLTQYLQAGAYDNGANPNVYLGPAEGFGSLFTLDSTAYADLADGHQGIVLNHNPFASAVSFADAAVPLGTYSFQLGLTFLALPPPATPYGDLIDTKPTCDADTGFDLQLNPDGTMTAYNGTTEIGTTTGDINVGGPHRILLERDADAGTLVITVDGNQVLSASSPGTWSYSGSPDIGVDFGSNGSYEATQCSTVGLDAVVGNIFLGPLGVPVPILGPDWVTLTQPVPAFVAPGASGTLTLVAATSQDGVPYAATIVLPDQVTVSGDLPQGCALLSSSVVRCLDPGVETLQLPIAVSAGAPPDTTLTAESPTSVALYNANEVNARPNSTYIQVATFAPPTITSASSASFTQGTPDSYTVTTSTSFPPGAPAPTLTETGPLPNGVSFTDNGDGTATIAGTAKVSGSFPITITAAEIVQQGGKS